MKRYNDLPKNWQQLIRACHTAPYSNINNIVFEDGQPVSIGEVEESILLKRVSNHSRINIDDFELKMQWLELIGFAQKHQNIIIKTLEVSDGLPNRRINIRPDINREFNQIN